VRAASLAGSSGGSYELRRRGDSLVIVRRGVRYDVRLPLWGPALAQDRAGAR
jgi:hypothetical protein